MAIFTWHNGEVPKEMKITQVYGLVFTQDGRMLLKVEQKKDRKVYSLAGGKPEVFDGTKEGTLRREFLEEVNTTLKEQIYLLGYQEVDEENGVLPYAQVRMVAIIDKIGRVQPDPDNGETYERLLTSPNRAIELLGWGKIAEQQILEAVKVAKAKFGLTEFIEKEEYV